MSVSIFRAQKRDLPEVAHVIASALVNDEVMAAIVPGERNRQGRLKRLVLSELRLGSFPGGVIDVARPAGGGPLLGVAAWEGPGHKASPLAELREQPRFLSAIGLRNLRRARELFAAFEDHRPTHPHWYLAYVAVTPEAQGSGVGTRLLRHRLAEIDDAGEAAYLEATTPASRQLYERLGFVEQRALDMTPSGQPVAMLRPAGERR